MADESLLNDSNLGALGSNDDDSELIIEDDYLKGAEMQIDPELEAIKARVKEMEEEAEKLKQLQSEVTKQMTLGSPTGATPIMSAEEKAEIDNRSIYVGNVDYGATAEELEAHFHGCGTINRVTILCNKADGHPKGFAYIEFGSKEFVETALAMNETLFRGRQIKVNPKRTNRPGMCTTNRFPRGMRGRASRVSRACCYGAHRGTRRPAYVPYQSPRQN
ncbi:polyadenylate-binding protein 2 [Culex quinquefasciatus]|uniref:Polyadenylate-binding protein 2 n=3 Tax=Culex pipiens complex TaxID=518105 RepID=B0WCB1_CULQU|nr:polyadenylate-binding protein 2 [Culex quinquefasciatus]|eukprot:XP_001846345.1 polyadenylate-binding protein 2 [Culex quinquefasciatus]